MNALELYSAALEKYKLALEDKALINVEPWSEIYLELQSCFDILNTANSEADNYSLQVKHPIDQFDLGNITIALYEDGLDYADIAEYHTAREFKITSTEVKKWLTNYTNSSVLEKTSLQHGSIFDTEYQLQSLFDRLNTQLKEIDLKDNLDYASGRTTKDEVYLAYCTEIRQTIKDAATLAEAVANMQKVERFQQIVLQCINEVSPTVRNKIIRLWQKEKQLFKGLV